MRIKTRIIVHKIFGTCFEAFFLSCVRSGAIPYDIRQSVHNFSLICLIALLLQILSALVFMCVCVCVCVCVSELTCLSAKQADDIVNVSHYMVSSTRFPLKSHDKKDEGKEN